MPLFGAANQFVQEANSAAPVTSGNTVIPTGLATYSTSPVPVDNVELPTLGLTPLPHQTVVAEAVRAGFRRLLLADEMGVGKTLSAILVAEDQQAFPALIVAPTSLTTNWKREIQRALPHRTVSVVKGRTPDASMLTGDFVVVPDSVVWSWTIEEQDRKAVPSGPLASRKWASLIVDECHILKNEEAKRTRAVIALSKIALTDDAVRLLMSGTPLVNRPPELVSILSVLGVLSPVFGGKAQFLSKYCEWETTRFGSKPVGARNTSELHTRLREQVMIRRLRKDVVDLPNKGRSLLYIDMDAQHARQYKQAETDLQSFMRNHTGNDDYTVSERAAALVLLGALRRVAGEGKIAGTIAAAEELLEQGEQVFIACMHTAVAAGLYAALHKHGAVSIVGGMTADQKTAAVDAFQSGKARVCIGNVTAAGVGFTLTAARHILVAELPWTPGALQQVEDRLHRIGQTREVISQVICANWDGGSVDERLWNLMDGKAVTIGAILDGDDSGLSLDGPAPLANALLDTYR